VYIPAAFQEPDRDIAFSLIEEIRLGSIVSAASRIESSHVVFLLDRDAGPNGRLIGHCARANPHWKAFEQGGDVLVTFLGPNTHVSPSWYGTHPRAPTWLYVSIHVRGKVQTVHDRASMREIVVRLSREMEPDGSPWSIDTVDEYVDRILPGIVGFTIDIDSIETQLRLAQQNIVEDRNRVLAALEAGHPMQRAVAELVRRYAFRDVRKSSGG
jgi:transcriptional regulator